MKLAASVTAVDRSPRRGLSGALTLGAAFCLYVAGTFPTQAHFPARESKLVWARSAGGPDFDFADAIATDPHGNSYVTGEFTDTATFGTGEANQTDLTSAGDEDIFVAKYARDGTLLWARSDGGAEFDHGSAIATDHRRNSYLIGIFTGTATFGAGEANQTELTSAGGQDIFVAKYAPDGALLWARSAGGTNLDNGSGIATDRHGDSYVTGRFVDTATFGAGEANQTELTSKGIDDVFVAKYSRNGVLLWARSAGGTDSDQAGGIATDRHGNSYVAGTLFGTATFGAGETNETELVPVGSADVFVAKYTPDGAFLWARSDGGPDLDEGFAIATDRHGDSYVTGLFSDTATFGGGETNETELTSAGAFDLLVAKYSRNGVLLWARSDGGTGAETGYGIATDNRGNAYVTGDFPDAATFGAGEANQTELASAGFFDVFVAKYARNGVLLWARSDGGAAEADRGRAIATDHRGNTYVTGIFGDTATFGAGEPNETELTSGDESDVFVAKYRDVRGRRDRR